jgi:hypothetical protein
MSDARREITVSSAPESAELAALVVLAAVPVEPTGTVAVDARHARFDELLSVAVHGLVQQAGSLGDRRVVFEVELLRIWWCRCRDPRVWLVPGHLKTHCPMLGNLGCDPRVPDKQRRGTVKISHGASRRANDVGAEEQFDPGT